LYRDLFSIFGDIKMSLDYINIKKIRKSFGKIPLVTSLPNLIEVQKIVNRSLYKTEI